MRCPKCQSQCADSEVLCPHCGIVFAKYFKYHPEQLYDEAKPESKPQVIIYAKDHEFEDAGSGFKQLLFESGKEVSVGSLILRLILLIFLIVWGLMLMSSSIEGNAVGQSFMHLINLPFHEAGHIFFRPFGSFITSLGGTLGQLLMPSVCLGVLLIKTRDPFGASVALWWVGENFLDIASYINDARAGKLPLLGGNFGHSAPYGFHDWEYLLTESGLLQYDHALAKIAFVIGSLLMLLSFIWGGMVLYKQYQKFK